MPSKINTGQTIVPGDRDDSPLTQVTRIYVAFVQGLFAACPLGAGYQWTRDLQTTGIVITDDSPAKTAVLNRRPAVTFIRSPVRTASLGVGDLDSWDERSGATTKSVLLPGVMHINALSRVKLESERLACVIWQQLWMNRSVLVGDRKLFDIGRDFVISPTGYAGSLVAEAGDEWWATTVSSPFQISETASHTPLNRHIAQEIRSYVQAARGEPVAALGAPASPLGFGPDYRVEAPAPGVEPPRQPHPLNPAREVIIRRVRPRGR